MFSEPRTVMREMSAMSGNAKPAVMRHRIVLSLVDIVLLCAKA
jgi:hypothetical protein